MKRALLIAVLLIFGFTGYADALCVRVSKANLRSGPGTKYKKTGEVFQYTPLKRLGRRGNWYKVKDMDGEVHWIYRTLVTNKFRCAMVKRETARIRTGPGTEYEETIDSPSYKYLPYKVLKIKGSWVKIMDDYNDTGWIHRDLLWIQ
jgi:SH3-like domain-containing protein